MSGRSDLAKPDTRVARTVTDVISRLRPQAGTSWLEAAQWEKDAREAWARLVALWPATRGTRTALLALAREAAAVVEGRRSALARAARYQPLPWDLSQEPLRAVQLRLVRFTTRAKELEALVAAVRKAMEHFDSLEAAYAGPCPAAWRRWTAESGVDAASIEGCEDESELRALTERMKGGERSLNQWLADLTAWLGAHGAAVADGSVQSWDTAEARYEALLSTGRADRRPIQARTALELRRAMNDHLKQLFTEDARREESVAHALAMQWAEIEEYGPLSAEEGTAYREAAMDLHVRRSARRFGRP